LKNKKEKFINFSGKLKVKKQKGVEGKTKFFLNPQKIQKIFWR